MGSVDISRVVPVTPFLLLLVFEATGVLLRLVGVAIEEILPARPRFWVEGIARGDVAKNAEKSLLGVFNEGLWVTLFEGDVTNVEKSLIGTKSPVL